MNQIVNVNSQSLLAKLLATEDISVQYKSGVKTAMFDLKHRVLILPIWENITEDLRHMLIGHETGHALDTPTGDEYVADCDKVSEKIFGKGATQHQKATVRRFMNVIEDVRVDKRQKRRYPGLRKNYLNGYKELIERDFFGTKNRDINTMPFIDKLNIYSKGGNILFKIEFTPEEKALLRKAEELETWKDTLAVTEEVYRYCKGKLENPDMDDLLIVEGMKSDQGDYEEDFDSEWDDEIDSDDNDDEYDDEGSAWCPKADEASDGDESGADGKGKSQEEDTNDQDGSSRAGAGASLGGDVEEHTPDSETERVWGEKVKSLVKDDNTEYVYVTMPDVDWKKAVHGYKKVLADWHTEINNTQHSPYYSILDQAGFEAKRREMMEWRMKEKDSISFLVKEFEQRKSAEIYSRTSIARTGAIDTNMLHAYKYNDDIFRRLEVIPEGKNHGFVMIIDWSGSMDHNLRYTIHQLFTLVLFCRQIQVPFEVYLFKDSGNVKSPWIHDAKKSNSLNLGPVVLRQVLSSKMTLKELNDAMTVLWSMGNGCYVGSDSLGGTPLNEAIILMPKIINDFRDKYKLEIVNAIVLTDGESGAINGLVNDNSGRKSYAGRLKNYKYFYNDPISGKTYDILPYGGWGDDGIANTSTLLKIVKDKCQVNLIGFYLWSDSWNRFVNRFRLGEDPSFLRKVTQFWKENKFYPVKTEGYDDYYIIDARSLKQEQNELVIDNTKSNKIMAKAFSKFAAKKTVNRVLLRQFITHVTSQAKVA